MTRSLSECHRFLLIEDEPIIAMNVAEQLEELGHLVVGQATTLDAAKCLAAVEHFDAALLDLNLHGKVADPVAEILVERKIPFALMTGYNEAPAGTFIDIAILRKPFTDAELKRTIDALFNRLSTPPDASDVVDQEHTAP
jgi:CheY-like chemotaxis protein